MNTIWEKIISNIHIEKGVSNTIKWILKEKLREKCFYRVNLRKYIDSQRVPNKVNSTTMGDKLAITSKLENYEF